MAEFFILKAYRYRGAGRSALAAALAAHPGDWHIAVPLANEPAAVFWGKALSSRAPAVRELTFEGDEWRLHAFAV